MEMVRHFGSQVRATKIGNRHDEIFNSLHCRLCFHLFLGSFTPSKNRKIPFGITKGRRVYRIRFMPEQNTCE